MENKKKGGEPFALPQFVLVLWFLLHKVGNCNQTIVFVGFVSVEPTDGSICVGRSERIRNHTVPSLEANLWLEGVFTNRTHHL